MKVLEVDSLSDEILENQKVFVQFGTSWCGNCRIMKPKIEKLGDDYPEVKFIYVDVEKFPNSKGLVEIAHLPSFALFEGGSLKGQKEGTKLEKIKELLL